MRKKIFYLFLLLFFTMNIEAQTVDNDVQRIAYGGMAMGIPEAWDCQTFPMSGDNFGFYVVSKDPLMSFFAVSANQESIDEILAEMLAEHSSIVAKKRDLVISETPQLGIFNGMTSIEYLLEGNQSLGKLIVLGRGEHKYIIFYCGVESIINSTKFEKVLASIDIDENWKFEDEYKEIDEFVQTKDGYSIYEEEGVSFEFPAQWSVQENSYSPESEGYILACEVSDSQTFFFTMSQQEVMKEEYINNLPQYEAESNVKYLSKKPTVGTLAGMKTKEYEFEIPSLSDLPPLKGKILFFNNEIHYFYILYGDKGSYKKNKDFERLFKSFKTE